MLRASFLLASACLWQAAALSTGPESGSFELKIYEGFRVADSKVVKSEDKTADVTFFVQQRRLGGAFTPVSFLGAQKHIKFMGASRPDGKALRTREVRTWDDSVFGVEPGYYVVESASGGVLYLIHVKEFREQGKAQGLWVLKCGYERFQAAD